MSENNETPKPIQKTEKKNRANNLIAAVRALIPKSPKWIYPLYDELDSEICAKHGGTDFYRAVFSSIFFKGASKVAAEKASRRKFRCNPSQKLDLSKFDHIASMFFEAVASWVTSMPQSSFRLLCIEHIPEMLAALTTVERETINIKTVQLINGRAARKKKTERIKTIAPAKEVLNNEIVEVWEIEAPLVISIQEPELELEPIPVMVTLPEITSTIPLPNSPENPIIDISAPFENISTPKKIDFPGFKDQEQCITY